MRLPTYGEALHFWGSFPQFLRPCRCKDVLVSGKLIYCFLDEHTLHQSPEWGSLKRCIWILYWAGAFLKSNWLVRMTQELNVPVYQREKGVACYLNDSASSHRDGAAFFSILICLIIDFSLLFYFNYSFH